MIIDTFEEVDIANDDCSRHITRNMIHDEAWKLPDQFASVGNLCQLILRGSFIQVDDGLFQRLLFADIALTSRLGRMLSSSVDLWALCVGGALREEELIDLLTGVGFQQVRTTHRFDCIKGTSGEFLARRLGVRSINLYARKSEPKEVQSAGGLAAGESGLGRS